MGSGRPATASGDSISRYIREIRTYPMQSAEEERELCRRWRDHQDISAVQQLVSSHQRLIVEIASGYRGYGLSEDLIGEGYVGLMRAVCRFDPDHGERFETYAVWWVRAAIQTYIFCSSGRYPRSARSHHPESARGGA
jgi:RNA polymerase sigma-32 factor